jgi:hypothetical protein
MTHTEYADKLVEEYENLIFENIVELEYQHYCRTAAIKCAIKQVEAEIVLIEAYIDKDTELRESYYYLKSLL